MGAKETGGRAAAPIVRAFMKVALENEPPVPFRVPENVSLVRVDPYTGQRTDPSNPRAILEAFIPGTEPNEGMMMLNQPSTESSYQDPSAPLPQSMDAAPDMGTGGLY